MWGQAWAHCVSNRPEDLRVICPQAEVQDWMSAVQQSIDFAKQMAERKKCASAGAEVWCDPQLNECPRKRMHAKRQDLHSNIASHLKNLTGTMKKRLEKKDLDALGKAEAALWQS